MQDCSLTLVETVIIIIYIYGRREYEDIRDSTKFEVYIYIYIYYLSNLLIFLLNNYIIP